VTSRAAASTAKGLTAAPNFAVFLAGFSSAWSLSHCRTRDTALLLEATDTSTEEKIQLEDSVIDKKFADPDAHKRIRRTLI
jgi:hypothetical protein